MSNPANWLQGPRPLLRFRVNMQGLGWGHTLERAGLASAKASCRPLIIALIFVIVLNAQIFAAEPRLGAPKTYLSPDQTLRVFVVPLPNAPYGQGESWIEMRNASNKLLFSHSFGSEDGEHGFGVEQAAWTPDSQFFVFSMSSSGGHQPWHSPTYFVARRDNKLRSLDDYLGPITDPEFKVGPPDIIRTVGQRKDDLEEATFEVRLSELLKQPSENAPANK